jgi:ABC-type multidrug transport system fused ATPase/permease subunit
MIALPIYNWRLSLVLFAIVPPMVVATVIFRRRLRDAFRKVRVRIARINAFLNENLSGIKIIQMFRQEAKRIREFHTINESYYDARFKQMMVFAVFRPLVDFLAMFATAAILWFGAHWIVVGVLTVGFLTAYLRFAEIFFEPVRDLTEKFNLLQQAMASGERIFMLLDEKKEAYDGVTIEKKVKGDIEFQNVWFAYNEEEWVLKDISFRVKPGERVAFVGATGAGKTSLINVLSRFYEIQKGRILLDGKDTRDIDKKFLRSNVGIVMQDVFLFLGDIETNIKLRSDLSQETVERAARTTNASQFISKLPDTYKSPVQERGVNLSVGERQLISFARALAFDPAILVLDEATSSVDTKTEALIQDAIHKLLEGRTSLIIAHRLSTVRDADRIIVLDHGRIVEEGSHEELMARKDVYYGLYKLQFEHKIS